MELTEFVLAMLAEDEAVARAATPGPWHKIDGGVTDLADQWPVSDCESDREQGDRVHIARHNPARVLAQVEVMRRVVAGYTSSDRHSPWGGCGDECEWKALEWALRALAAIWRENLDFDPAWEA